MWRRILTSVFSAMGMCMLILDAKTALNGAAEGIDLCIRVVIPSLFPFFILSMLLTSTLHGASFKAFRPVGRLCGIPEGTESLLIIGFLGGYPVGAQNVAQAYRDGQLSKNTAERMLGFCNNAGPAFLFGIIGMKFPQWWYPWLLWAILILSALITAMLLPGKDAVCAAVPRAKPISLQIALRRSIRIMAEVCGWIIVFRILMHFLGRWILWLLPDVWQTVITGLLELTNGCCGLDQIQCIGLRFVSAAALLSFGGLCVSMQTVSACAPLALKTYYFAKVIQTGCAVVLAFFTQKLILPPTDQLTLPAVFTLLASVVLAFFAVICRESEKKSSIPQMIGV